MILDVSAFFGSPQVSFGPTVAAVLGRVEDRDVLADDLARLVALDALGAKVPGQDVAIGSHQEDRVVGDRLDQETKRLRSVGEFSEGPSGAGSRVTLPIHMPYLGDCHE